jgi:parallel beta-helix repeat protein
MPSSITHRIAATIIPFAASAALFAAPASADVSCTKVASPSGSDAAAGTDAAPFKTATKLANSLSPGDVGCLHAGTYVEDLRMGRGGNAAAPVTLTSYPGERAKVVGRFYVPKGSNFVTVSNLDLNGTPSQGTNDANDPSPTINAEDVSFVGNDVTNDNNAICFLLGNSWGAVKNTLIQGNRIHNCGRLPAENHAHGIYVEISTDARIIDNVIYDNADRGVQLYHDAQGTLIRGNVIDGNGEGIIFSGDYGYTSNNNIVEDNIISNSRERNNVESWYPSGNPIGKGNVVRNNCIGGGGYDRGNGGIASEWGFTVEKNNVISKNQKFVDRGGKDFRLQAGSPCTGIANGATGSTAARDLGTSAPTTTPPAPTTSNPTPSPEPTQTATNPVTHQSGPVVSLRTVGGRGGKVRFSGRVRRSGTVRSAGAAAAATKAVVQLRFDGTWYPLKSVPVRGNRFHSQLRIPATMRGRILRLRVVVPTVGKSHTVKVRAR